MPKTYYVYIITNKTKTTLYIGVKSNLAERIEQHSEGQVKSFSKRYRLKHLIYYEEHDNPDDAIQREKQLKKWNRAWKERLIKEFNPDWRDLSRDSEWDL